MRGPDFFIVGAPKCGTTALQHYLARHPSIFMCEPKEPNFFTDFEYPRFRSVNSVDGYLRLFSRAKESDLAVGEASASYLFLEEAIARIRQFAPEARLIVLLRDPVAFVQAWHAQLVYSHEETETDLETAWNLQETRRAGHSIPTHCRDVRALLYRDVADFAPQLEVVFRHFPRGKVLVLLQEELARDTAGVYGETLDFLGVPNDGRTDFPRVNVAKVARDGPLLSWTAQPPLLLLRVVRTLKRTLRLPERSLQAAWRRRRALEAPRPALEPSLRKLLENELRPGVERLAELLDRNLQAWPTARGAGSEAGRS